MVEREIGQFSNACVEIVSAVESMCCRQMDAKTVMPLARIDSITIDTTHVDVSINTLK